MGDHVKHPLNNSMSSLQHVAGAGLARQHAAKLNLSVSTQQHLIMSMAVAGPAKEHSRKAREGVPLQELAVIPVQLSSL